jgi:hypothetical protein
MSVFRICQRSIISLAFRYLCQRFVTKAGDVHLFAVAGSIVPTGFVCRDKIIKLYRSL